MLAANLIYRTDRIAFDANIYLQSTGWSNACSALNDTIKDLYFYLFSP